MADTQTSSARRDSCRDGRHIERITLRQLLPAVFSGRENESAIRESGIWLREIIFDRGNTYLIEAESGTGKSSLCNFIYGERTDYSGSILFDGNEGASLTIAEWCGLRRTSLAYLPQEMRLFPELTALENVEIKNNLTGFRTRDEIIALLRRLELGDRIDYPAARLSIGQQQRVAIVRSLCQPFDFLLLDEPVSHLDSRINRIVADLIAEEASRQGAAIIATSVGNQIKIPFGISLSL